MCARRDRWRIADSFWWDLGLCGRGVVTRVNGLVLEVPMLAGRRGQGGSRLLGIIFAK
jgi:hypothetical protein